MMRRMARRATARHARSARVAAERQLAFEFADEAAEPVAGLEPAREPEAASQVLDLTPRISQAAEERRRAGPAAASHPASHATGIAPASEEPEADDWFELACEIEDESPARAREAYHRALALEPAMTDAHVNLGRLYHEERDLAKAEAHYRAATSAAPDDPIPWFNLGVLLEDAGRSVDALEAYARALERDPEHADAHYNIGLLHEQLGHRSEAMHHLMQARRLYGALS